MVLLRQNYCIFSLYEPQLFHNFSNLSDFTLEHGMAPGDAASCRVSLTPLEAASPFAKRNFMG